MLYRCRYLAHRLVCLRVDMYAECSLGCTHPSIDSVWCWVLVDLHGYQQLHHRQLHLIRRQCSSSECSAEEYIGDDLPAILDKAI